MSNPSNYRCNFAKDYTLTAATPLAIDVPIDGAQHWTVIVKNTGDTNAVTAGTLAKRPLDGGQLGPATSLPTGIPLAAGASLEVSAENTPLKDLRLTLTSTSGTTVRNEAGGV
jgi:hypothetical protein